MKESQQHYVVRHAHMLSGMIILLLACNIMAPLVAPDGYPKELIENIIYIGAVIFLGLYFYYSKKHSE